MYATTLIGYCNWNGISKQKLSKNIRWLYST